MSNGQMALSRRAFLGGAAGLCAAPAGQAGAQEKPAGGKLKVAVFSKHLRFLEGEELAKAAAGVGFDGIDLAVREGGHVAPDRVQQDLPPLAGIIRRHGLELPMLTTDIVDAESPFAEDILAAMSGLGIRYYRWGGLRYAPDRPLAPQIEEMKPRVAKLAALNARYGTCAMYHTHSGTGVVGASIWDLHDLLQGFDPHRVGVNYDVGHATVEGGVGGWINSFRITGPHLRGIAVKDFVWRADAKRGWGPQWTPLGEGMVHLREFFALVAASGFSGPLQMHFEYPLGGADSGSPKLSVSPDVVFSAMKRDLDRLRARLREAGLA
jgi:sugar phosphate isomerase/epimerase